MPTDPVRVAALVARALDALGIPYLVGGSVASTLFGEPRTTLDVDFAVQLEPEQARALREALGSDFHCDEELVRDAARRKRLVNVIHLPTMVKADLHVRPAEGIYASEMKRALRTAVGGPDGPVLRVATPEDTVLQKLRWYEAGARASDRQWRDVLGILKTSGARLEREYMQHWARELGVSELLERVCSEAGLD